MHSLDRALRDLADGGYVIDLRPLADHPKLTSWVFHAPMSDGRIAGVDKTKDGSAGSLDYVSASYMAVYIISPRNWTGS